jgi:hypothetical protein
MEKSNSTARKKTSMGNSIGLYCELLMAQNTGSNILINIKENYYYLDVKTSSGESKEEPLSNFIIDPLYFTQSKKGITKYILKFISNNHSKVVELDGETLAINNSFKKFCINQGKFNWKGKQQHLDDLIDFIMVGASKEITMIPYIGWNSKEKIWIFPTHAYFQGNVYFPDNDGIFEIDNRYFKLEVDKDDEYFIHPHISTEPSKEQIVEFFNGLKILYKDYLYLGFGYMASSFHVDAIAEKTDFFPFLYVHGKHSQGKSALINIFSKFSGMKVSLTNPPSLDGLRKGISGKANLPFIIDEAEDKNDKSRGRDFFKYLSDTIKVIYMRSILKRGHKDEEHLVLYPTRGTLFLGGEVLTSVASIIQRSILIDSSKITKNEEVYQQVRDSQVPFWIGQFLMRTSHEWQSNLINLYYEITGYFIKQGWTNIDVRIRCNYAIFLAGAFAALKHLNNYFGAEVFPVNNNELKNIFLFVYDEMKETKRMTEDDHPSMKFLTKLGLLVNKDVLRKGIDYKYVKQKDGQVHLYLAPSNIIEAYKSHEKDPFYSTSNKVVKDIQNQSYFLGTRKIRIGQSQPTAWIIQLTHPNNPDSIKEGIIHPDLPETMIYFYK